jgi:hypothetical protein
MYKIKENPGVAGIFYSSALLQVNDDIGQQHLTIQPSNHLTILSRHWL